MTEEAQNAIVVLGCRVQDGRPTAALERRLVAAMQRSDQRPHLPVVLSGGRSWGGVVESQAMATWWRQRRPDTELVEEGESQNTAENARCVARLCRERGWRSVQLVTSDFHMSRAVFEFRRRGLAIQPVIAPTPPDSAGHRRRRWRERMAHLIARLRRPSLLGLALLGTGCPSKTEDSGQSSKRGADQPTKQEPGGGSAAPSSSATSPPLQLDAITPALRGFATTAHFSLQPEVHEKAVSQAKRALYGTPEQRLWAAFGLGRYCARSKSPEVLAALVNATALWATEETAPAAVLLANTGWAIGSCSLPESEDVLRAWLSPENRLELPGLDAAAALGLAAAVDRRGVLSERTQTSVLNAAGRLNDASILLPLSRLPQLSEAVGAHLLEVAGTLLTQEAGASRRTAIVALRGAGPSAAAPLAQILIADNYTPGEQAAAARALGQLGGAGQGALDEAVATQLSRGLPLEAENPRWVPLLASVEELETTRRSKSQLRQLFGVALPSEAERTLAAQRRRLIRLRCRAADLLAGTASLSRTLQLCDPNRGRAFALAQLRVLDRDTIDGKRLELFEEHLGSKDPLIVQSALRLLARHSEVEHQPALVLEALASPTAGTRTTALQLVSAYPGRFGQARDLEHHQALLTRLADLLSEQAASETPQETRSAALLAAGALHALNLKPLLEAHCRGDEPLLWKPAERALSLLEKNPPHCPPPSKRPGPTASVGAPVPESNGPTVVAVESDLGPLELHLDATSAPQARRHVLRLMASGEYDASVIGSSRLGFAVQFGDEHEDGYDDVPAPGLPFEVSPELYAAHSVGLSSFAPGSEHRQIFVTLTAAPQLHGSRIRLGTAQGPWDLLVEGDVLHRLRPLTK